MRSGSRAGKAYFVYIITNPWHAVLYTGVTSDLKARVYQHREKLVAGFTQRYNVTKLVYYVSCAEPSGAIALEKRIKAGTRRKKIELVNSVNPEWLDLYESL